MDPRLQVLALLLVGSILLAYGITRACTRGRIGFKDKIDYGYVLKSILGSLALAAGAISFGLTLVFIVSWSLHEDVPGMTPQPLEAFLPRGYPVHCVTGLVVAGAFCIFAMALIAYLDHVNTG